MEHQERDVNDLGLAADLEMMRRSLINRRRILKMGALGIGLPLAGERSRAAESSAAPAQQSSAPVSYLPLILGPAALADMKARWPNRSVTASLTVLYSISSDQRSNTCFETYIPRSDDVATQVAGPTATKVYYTDLVRASSIYSGGQKISSDEVIVGFDLRGLDPANRSVVSRGRTNDSTINTPIPAAVLCTAVPLVRP